MSWVDYFRFEIQQAVGRGSPRLIWRSQTTLRNVGAGPDLR